VTEQVKDSSNDNLISETLTTTDSNGIQTVSFTEYM
jgi:hypothetical protein